MPFLLTPPTFFPDPTSPTSDLLSTLDNEDPVARALFKMVEFNDKVQFSHPE